jgi:hypothetical protein
MLEPGWYGQLQLMIFVDLFSVRNELPLLSSPYPNKTLSAMMQKASPFETCWLETIKE